MNIPFLLTITEDQFKTLVKDLVNQALSAPGAGPNADNELLSAEEAASFTKLAVCTIYDKTSTRQIPHYKIGSKLMFKRAELMKWIEQGKIATETELQSIASTSPKRRSQRTRNIS